MASTALLYSGVFSAAFNKEIDLLADTIYLMLCTNSYVVAQDTHDYKDDVTNEVSGTNYTAGGTQLLTDTFTYTAGTNVWKYDAADTVFSNVTITGIRIGVIYDRTPASDATRPLILSQEETSDFSPSAADFTMQWNASGIFTITLG